MQEGLDNKKVNIWFPPWALEHTFWAKECSDLPYYKYYITLLAAVTGGTWAVGKGGVNPALPMATLAPLGVLQTHQVPAWEMFKPELFSEGAVDQAAVISPGSWFSSHRTLCPSNEPVRPCVVSIGEGSVEMCGNRLGLKTRTSSGSSHSHHSHRHQRACLCSREGRKDFDFGGIHRIKSQV